MILIEMIFQRHINSNFLTAAITLRAFDVELCYLLRIYKKLQLAMASDV